jgi:hypothetical protein
MNGLFEAALEIQEFIQRHGWRFAIIGRLAAVPTVVERPGRAVESASASGVCLPEMVQLYRRAAERSK